MFYYVWLIDFTIFQLAYKVIILRDDVSLYGQYLHPEVPTPSFKDWF